MSLQLATSPQQECKHCDFTAKTKSVFNRHLLEEHGVLPYECNLCSKSFRSQVSYWKHDCDNKSFFETKCNLCNRWFSSALEVKAHVCTMKEKCKHCGEQFASKATLRTHRCVQQLENTDDFNIYNYPELTESAQRRKGGPRKRTRSFIENNNNIMDLSQKDIYDMQVFEANYEPLNKDMHEHGIPNKNMTVPAGVEDALPLVITGMKQVTEDSLWQCVKCGCIMTPEGQNHHTCSDDCGQDALGNFRCPKCDASYTRRDNRNRHVWRNHLQKAYYSCDVCHQCCDSHSDLENHIASKHGDQVVSTSAGATKGVECDVCYATCSTPQGLEAHKRRHSGEKPYVCPVCFSSFSSSHNMTVHMRLHTGEHPYMCEICNTTFIHRQSLTRHLERHRASGGSKFKCTQCSAEFDSVASLTAHNSASHAKPSFSELNANNNNNNIDVKDSYNDNNNVSILNHSNGNNNNNNTMPNKNNVQEVGEVGSQEATMPGSPLRCKTCGIKFTTRSALKIHMKVHKLDRQYKCTICGCAFAWKGFLDRHMEVHLSGAVTNTNDPKIPNAASRGGSDYKCKVCHIPFLNAEEMIQHMSEKHDISTIYNAYMQLELFKGLSDVSLAVPNKIVPVGCASVSDTEMAEAPGTNGSTSYKQFQCLECGDVLSSKRRLISHLQIHEAHGMVSHICRVCGAKFSRLSFLTKHLISHSKTETLTCKICFQECSPTGLSSHMDGHRKDWNLEKALLMGPRENSPAPKELCEKSPASVVTNHDIPVPAKTADTPQLIYDCKMCSEKFAAKHQLYKHVSAKHPLTSYRFKCNKCLIGFKSYDEAEQHVLDCHCPTDDADDSSQKGWQDISPGSSRPSTASPGSPKAAISDGGSQYRCRGCGAEFLSYKDALEHRHSESDTFAAPPFKRKQKARKSFPSKTHSNVNVQDNTENSTTNQSAKHPSLKPSPLSLLKPSFNCQSCELNFEVYEQAVDHVSKVHSAISDDEVKM